jgi:hypothetical protein
MQDQPSAPELLDAVAEYLFGELRPVVPAEQRFKVLVAANVCTVVARELRAGEAPSEADLALFQGLLGEEAGGVDAAAEALSARIREGDYDDRLPELLAALRAHVSRKLDVSRPGYQG